eukprot:TRINITY_DN31208_c0_g1_i2.p2 TRINITY_DN31208_c0_g1~~TRINITY_DN31208_c0_g1_i2.p2  ORF type:complete len:141 (+),score=27.64 TRINITY_DN31208_c0_g1_i2:586-1008(+)
MTGVFCQSAIESSRHDHNIVVADVQRDRSRFENMLSHVFSKIDDDGSGCITISEFESHFEDQAVQAFFLALDLEAADAWTLFRCLDQDSDHGLTIAEFVDGCLQIRGTAKAIDLAGVRRELRHVKGMMKKLAQKVLQKEQ